MIALRLMDYWSSRVIVAFRRTCGWNAAAAVGDEMGRWLGDCDAFRHIVRWVVRSRSLSWLIGRRTRMGNADVMREGDVRARSELLADYLGEGLRDIVVIAYEWYEEGGGYQNERSSETVVARQGEKWVCAIGRMVATFSPYGGSYHASVSIDREVSEEDYGRLRNGRPTIDTAAALKEVVAQEKQKREAVARQQKLTKAAPSCPKCSRRMAARYGRYGYFWSCSGFPKNCDGTKRMTAAQKKLASGK